MEAITFWIWIIASFLCIGSFLNVVAWRLISHKGLFSRSACPSCHKTIIWYDLLPVFSWVLLRGKCRHCQSPISWLYPAIEILTAITGCMLFFYVPPHYWLSYSIFCTALIITMRTDAEFFLISRFASLYLIPVGWLLSYFHLLPLTLAESIFSSIFGYSILWSIAQLFYIIRKKQAIGEGDFELLGMIGAFTGAYGIWTSITIGSFVGSIYGIYQIATLKTRNILIPFGVFLALGAISHIYLLYNGFFDGLV